MKGNYVKILFRGNVDVSENSEKTVKTVKIRPNSTQKHDQLRIIILGVSKKKFVNFFCDNEEVQFVRFGPESFPRFALINCKCLYSSSDLTTMLEASDDAVELIRKVGERIKRNIFSVLSHKKFVQFT